MFAPVMSMLAAGIVVCDTAALMGDGADSQTGSRMPLGAVVLLPKDYDKDPARRFAQDHVDHEAFALFLERQHGPGAAAPPPVALDAASADVSPAERPRLLRIHEVAAATGLTPRSIRYYEELGRALAPSPHFVSAVLSAGALVRGGHCRSLDEAFERFLKKNRPAWVPKAKMSALEAIELIHHAGGLAVMAHPGLNRTDDRSSVSR